MYLAARISLPPDFMARRECMLGNSREKHTTASFRSQVDRTETSDQTGAYTGRPEMSSGPPSQQGEAYELSFNGLQTARNAIAMPEFRMVGSDIDAGSTVYPHSLVLCREL